ncbi:MAG: BolA/IbaG family iron-sulfur metabolism protein [Gammaproteobacteria bacterium]|nr:BolA/IbaG family iron-sulfur metabolism protein [Gammaproteobacteria bacterium]
MVSSDEIKTWIEQGLPTSQVHVTGDGQHFEAVIVCADFAQKNTLARHRMVYDALGDKMKDVIHALSMKTLTPDEKG